jgi:hypothetical protein
MPEAIWTAAWCLVPVLLVIAALIVVIWFWKPAQGASMLIKWNKARAERKQSPWNYVLAVSRL